MFKQLVGKKTLLQSLLCTLLVCLAVFCLVGCNSNYTLNGSTTNGNQGKGSTSSGGSGSTGSTNSGSSSTGSGTFQVIGLDLTVSPASLSGIPCASQATFTYTATFHIAPNGPGGTVQFVYSPTGADNDPNQINKTQDVQPGQTTVTYQFQNTGEVDPTASGYGVNGYPAAFPYHWYMAVVNSNQLRANAVPTGPCQPG